MERVRWAGHPFVDAGLSAIAAVTGVSDVKDLEAGHLEHAAAELVRVLLSDQALGIGVEKSFARGALSQLFPNSELVNPSNWRGRTPEEKAENVRRKFQEALRQDLERAKISLRCSGDVTCSVCGRKVSEDAAISVRKDRMPLLTGIVNFYPALSCGMQICGLCAFAIRFLPMSVMQTGVSKRLWFLHTWALEISAEISRRYCWCKFNEAIAANESLQFYSRWQTAGDAGTALYVLCELLDESVNRFKGVYLCPPPITVYLFSNDNQKPSIQLLPVSGKLLLLLVRLRFTSIRAFHRFWKELLLLPGELSEEVKRARIRFVQEIGRRLLDGENIVSMCLEEADGHRPQALKLQGGWPGHALYLQEVRGMPEGKLAILERLGLDIARRDDVRKRVLELKKSGRDELYAVFLRYVREGLLRHDEFYTLLPPNNDACAGELRDVLLAVIYEWQYCQEEGEEFLGMTKQPVPNSDETLQRIQQIGGHLCQRLLNLSSWIRKLQTARSDEGIRGAYLSAVRQGAMRFADFVFLAPLNDYRRMRHLRDYLLAFLFERARDVLPVGEDVAVLEGKADENI